MYPRDRKDLSKAGRLRLLYEANPIGFLIEQAGGRASTGHQPILEVQPQAAHERIGFVFGAATKWSASSATTAITMTLNTMLPVRHPRPVQVTGVMKE